METIYVPFLPKGTRPFIYLSLQLDPLIVDVNIHPTKSEVRFLYQDEIIDKIKETVIQFLEAANQSRTFYNQPKETTTVVPDITEITETAPVAKITPQTKSKSQSKLVRVDHKEQTLNAYWEPKDVNKNTKSKEDDNPVQVPKKRAHKDEGSKDDILDDDFETVSIPTKTSSSSNKKKKNLPSKKN